MSRLCRLNYVVSNHTSSEGFMGHEGSTTMAPRLKNSNHRLAGGKLQGVLTVSEAALSLPDLNISDIRGKSSFEWEDNQPQVISADFVFSHIGLPGCGPQDEAFEQGVITLQINGTDARMKGELLAAEHASGLAFTVALNDYRHQPDIVADVTAEVNADSVIWCLSGLSQPDKGSASLTVRADGKTPALRTAGDNWRRWLQHSTLQGQGILRPDGPDFAPKNRLLDESPQEVDRRNLPSTQREVQTQHI